MKYVMNGGLIIGSRDGANLEIEKELGSQNIFMFGSDKGRIYGYQQFLKEKPQGLSHVDVTLQRVFDFCKGREEYHYITEHFIKPLEAGIDPNGICLDFNSYNQAMEEAHKMYFSSWQKCQLVYAEQALHHSPKSHSANS